MKQNDSYQDFDKQVQQLLGQASEPVPESAWEAIAARLAAGAGASSAAAEAGAARKAVILKWVRRTGIAVAAAAAVLLAVLLWNRPENTTDDNLAVVTEQTQDEMPAVQVQTLARNNTQAPDETPAVTLQQSAVAPTAVTPDKAASDQSAHLSDESDQSTRISDESNQSAHLSDEAGSNQGAHIPGGNYSNHSAATASSIAIASQGAVLAQAETQPAKVQATEAPTKPQPTEVQSEPQTAETQEEPEAAESQVEPRTAEVQPTESQAEPLTAEAEVQPIDWENLPDLDEEVQARPHKKYQPNGFHLAAYTNALSNFTSKKSGQYTGYSGASGGTIPDHSYFRESGESNYTIPLTFGINFAYDILPKLSVGLGVNYTRLSRHFSGTYYQMDNEGKFDAGTDYDNIYNIQQFIGIPLSVYYHIVRTKHINFYVYANGTVEKCIGNAWTANNREINYNEPVKGVQFNAGGGIGVDFMLAPLVSIYLDPNVKYYFGLNQPKSIRTQQPFMLGFEAGVRFHL
ncbi:MAG: hypothetical protein IJU13_01935 [Bacteroidales bacterium]|nr:hypothetical protein [Bacteroidales bacterium]